MPLMCEPIHRLKSENSKFSFWSLNCHFQNKNHDYNYLGQILNFLKYPGIPPIYYFCGISQNSPYDFSSNGQFEAQPLKRLFSLKILKILYRMDSEILQKSKRSRKLLFLLFVLKKGLFRLETKNWKVHGIQPTYLMFFF